MESDTATALAQAVRALDAAAVTAKRAERHQRERARELRQAAEPIKRLLAEHGIELEIHTGPGGSQ